MTISGSINYNPVADFQVPLAGSPTGAEAMRLCREASAFFERGLLRECVESFSGALRIEPRCRGAYYALAVCFAKAGQPDDALRFLESELELPVPHPRAAVMRGDLLQLQLRDRPAAEPQPPSSEQAGSPSPFTLFTMPKPFTGMIGIIQRNAIRSWLRLTPRPEVLLLGDEEGVREAAQEFGVRHLPQVSCNEHGTPQVNSIFETAQAHATNDLMSYINTDIILFDDFPRALALTAQGSSDFLMIGRRFDLDVWDELDFSLEGTDAALKERAQTEGFLHEPTGIDYFAFRRGLYRGVLPFAVGRTAWDNWLIWFAKKRGATLIDATRMAMIVHQEHDYNHVKGGVLKVWNGAEAQANRALAGADLLTIDASDYALQDGSLIPRDQASFLPSPSYADYGRLKVHEASVALSRGLNQECVDLLDYIEHLIEQKPRGLKLLRAQLALKQERLKEARAALLEELALFPDNTKAKGMLRFVDLALSKEEALPAASPQSCNCLFINTYYGAFLQNYYGRHPELKGAGYQAQLDSLTAECFGDSDFYSEGLKRQGWLAQDLIVNALPLQAAWAREHGFTGNEVQIVLEQIRTARPDVVYLQDLSLASRGFIEAIRPLTTLIVAQIASPVPEGAYLEGIDIIFSSFPHFVKRFRLSGITSYYQPLAFDPRVLKRTDEPARDIPVSFVGGISPNHGKGLQMLEAIAGAIPIDFWGYGAHCLAPGSPIASHHHGEAWGREMFTLLRRSRITVNRHIDVAEDAANNMRLFEATGCGALLITDFKENLGELFEIGSEVVAYRTPEECAALIRYYQEHPEEAEAIARAGQARTLRDHSYATRMEQSSLILKRHLREREDRERFAALDPATISYGHTKILESEIRPELVSAWQDRSIPEKQRGLVHHELQEMYHGGGPIIFPILADTLRPHLPPGAPVLEVGCASGYYSEILEYLLNRRLDYTGVDYSEAMIEMAKEYYPQAKFFAADGASLFFADRAFHTVISSCVLLHVPNYREHIFESARVADRFIVASRTPVCRKRPTQYLKKFAYGVETVELIFNEAELLQEFALNGFTLKQGTQYHSNEAADEYQATYLFQRG